jgi:acetyl-CoA carboxylase carboxyl transferase subunit beta
MAVFTKPNYAKPSSRTKKREMPEGLWIKCTACHEVLFTRELEANQMVCMKCNHHFAIGARERLTFLLDPDSFEEFDANMEAVDVLKFSGAASYTDKLESHREKTKLKDAVISGMGLLEGQKVAIAVMDFEFLGGSMGSVVGEKITRTIERGTKAKIPVIVICASGGARMYEGMLSLMQMAKTSGALARHAEAKQVFISVLTNPTMAGVMASYATLGDLIVAEPKAMIGFAGARVIKETTQQDLPKGFQTAEFLLDRGLVDLIIPRLEMRAKLSRILAYLTRRK